MSELLLASIRGENSDPDIDFYFVFGFILVLGFIVHFFIKRADRKELPNWIYPMLRVMSQGGAFDWTDLEREAVEFGLASSGSCRLDRETIWSRRIEKATGYGVIAKVDKPTIGRRSTEPQQYEITSHGTEVLQMISDEVAPHQVNLVLEGYNG